MRRFKMVRDYADAFIYQKSRKCRKKIASPKNFISTARFMWKTLGVMLLITVVISITSTFWYGMQVQSALDQIGKGQTVNRELADENRLLIAQRDLLLTRKSMEKAAQKLGLQTPAKDQLRYP